MAEVIQLPAEARERAGKGASRAIRREGRIPAVIYGDKKDVTMLTMDVRHVAKEYNKGGFFSRLFEVVVDGKAERVLPRELHPVTDVPLHADFLRLSKGVKIRVNIPVTFTNEEISIGLKRGGILNIVRHEIEFMVPPDSMPESIEIDMEKWDVGDSIHIEDITLPGDITATIDRNFTIATIASPVVEKEVEEDVEEGEEGEEGEAAEGEAEGDAEE
jgi:large subunit ribosomal protein L25